MKPWSWWPQIVMWKYSSFIALKPIETWQDLKDLYPTQFDTVGKFKGPPNILLKPDAEPHIDRPRKYNINLNQIKEPSWEGWKTYELSEELRSTQTYVLILFTASWKSSAIPTCLPPYQNVTIHIMTAKEHYKDTLKKQKTVMIKMHTKKHDLHSIWDRQCQ